MGMGKFVLVAVDTEKASSPDVEPEARALLERIRAVCKFAREHIIDTRSETDGRPLFEPERMMEIGPLRCLYFHAIATSGRRVRQLNIMGESLDAIPPPFMCAVIAKMFGFTGRMFDDYEAGPGICACGNEGCEAGKVTFIQTLPVEN